MLSTEEKFVCEIIWGCIPVDELWIRTTQIFKDAIERFKTDNVWQELFKKINT